jgi:hypothetical protein
VVLANLILGHNIFKGPTPRNPAAHLETMPIPDFRTLDGRVDERLNNILQRASRAISTSASARRMR